MNRTKPVPIKAFTSSPPTSAARDISPAAGEVTVVFPALGNPATSTHPATESVIPQPYTFHPTSAVANRAGMPRLFAPSPDVLNSADPVSQLGLMPSTHDCSASVVGTVHLTVLSDRRAEPCVQRERLSRAGSDGGSDSTEG